jgi:hypothetical protein
MIADTVTSPGIGQIVRAGESGRGLVERMLGSWRARRFAMVTAPLHLHLSLVQMQKDLKRLFGAELSDEELSLVAKGRG